MTSFRALTRGQKEAIIKDYNNSHIFQTHRQKDQ